MAYGVAPNEIESNLSGAEIWSSLNYLNATPTAAEVCDVHLSRISAILTRAFGGESKPEDHSILFKREPMTAEEDGLAWIGLLKEYERINKT